VLLVVLGPAALGAGRDVGEQGSSGDVRPRREGVEVEAGGDAFALGRVQAAQQHLADRGRVDGRGEADPAVHPQPLAGLHLVDVGDDAVLVGGEVDGLAGLGGQRAQDRRCRSAHVDGVERVGRQREHGRADAVAVRGVVGGETA
jgi:hypothetical protein